MPLLSLSIDFYVRVFVRVYVSPNDVKESSTKQSYIYQSQGCDSFFLQKVGRKVRRYARATTTCMWLLREN